MSTEVNSLLAWRRANVATHDHSDRRCSPCPCGSLLKFTTHLVSSQATLQIYRHIEIAVAAQPIGVALHDMSYAQVPGRSPYEGDSDGR